MSLKTMNLGPGARGLHALAEPWLGRDKVTTLALLGAPFGDCRE